MPLGCDSLSLLTGRIFCPLGVTEPTFLTPITPLSWSYVLTNEIESLVYLCEHSVRSRWTISKGKGMNESPRAHGWKGFHWDSHPKEAWR